MIFTVQRYVEDYLAKRGADCQDDYAVRLANLYAVQRSSLSRDDFLSRMKRVRTTVFRNADVERAAFESKLLTALDRKFSKKKADAPAGFVREAKLERRRLRTKRASLRAILQRFKRATEARGLDVFWNSRKSGKLQSRPEKNGQALLSVFAMEAIGERGLVLRELQSGTGYLDVSIVLGGGVQHLIELKVWRSGSVPGVAQLATYMKTESRKEGWLVLFDARKKKTASSPEKFAVPEGVVRVVVVEINPTAPSKKP